MSLLSKQKSVSDVLGNLAAAQTISESMPYSFSVSSDEISASFDVFSLINVLFKKFLKGQTITEFLVKKMTDKLGDNDYWLQAIEESIKLVIEANLTKILTCELSPIIPDRLIGLRTNYAQEYVANIVESGEGLIIPASFIDLSNILSKNPATTEGGAYYFTCKDDAGMPLSVNNFWKHDDFNAFLWYVKNRGEWGDATSCNKLTWDNRYKSQPYKKYKRKPETFFTKGGDGVTPFDKEWLTSYNSSSGNTQGEKKQILEVKYIDEIYPLSDSYIITLPASNYYRTRNLFGRQRKLKLMINKTMFEFNHQFLMSIKLYDAKTFLTSIIANLTGTGNLSFNFSFTKDQDIVDELINAVVNKTIQTLEDDVSYDCVYTFSNEEYDTMIETVRSKSKTTISSELQNSMDLLGNIAQSTTKQERKETIQTIIEGIASTVDSAETITDNKNSFNFTWNKKFELIRMFVYPFIRPLFSPKVLTVLFINLSVMGDPFHMLSSSSGTTEAYKVTDLGLNSNAFSKVLEFLYPIIKGVVEAVVKMLVEMLYRELTRILTQILQNYALKALAEQINYYKKLIQNLITSCFGSGGLGSGIRSLINGNSSALDDVNYADIDEDAEKMKYTPLDTGTCT